MKEYLRTKKLPDVPIVALTSYSNQSKVEECLAVGISKVYAKPLAIEKLHEMVHRYLFKMPE